MKTISLVWFLFLSFSLSSVATKHTQADTFGSGVNSFEIEFVPIGNPGNAYDPSGQPTRWVVVGPGSGRGGPEQELVGPGAVDYQYRIGKFEISEQMIDKANALGSLGITKDTRGPDKPATSITWFEAARFVNWLNEDQGFTPAYKFDTDGSFLLWEPSDPGYNPENLFRNRLARYAIPSSDEWYKAAYYDPVADLYNQFPIGPGDPTAVLSGADPGTAVFGSTTPSPTGPADIMKAGGLSPYSTIAQGGNVSEWLETSSDSPDNNRFGRGGNWESSSFGLSTTSIGSGPPTSEAPHLGFRVARVPEPNAIVLFFLPITLWLLNQRYDRCRYECAVSF